MNLLDVDFAQLELKVAASLKHCPKCGGAGWYCYSTRGTPHYTVCDMCCKHDKGYWLLEKYYGENNGKWCCKAGCGHTIENKPEDVNADDS